MEKVGQQYLKELVARHLVSLTLMDYLICDNEFVTIHEHIHAFLCFQAQDTNFVEVHGGDDFLPLASARRLSLQNNISKYAALDNHMPKLWSVLACFEKDEDTGEEEFITAGKSLICSSLSSHGAKSKRRNNSYIRQLLQGSHFLRVINIQGLEVGLKLPNEIGNVLHLQYLGIKSCSLREIPPSIGRLINLQTLDVRGTNVTELPESFWQILTLRHVFGDGIILPRRVGRLKYIQTLESVTPDEKIGWDENTLAEMLYLSCLFIWKLSALNKDNLLAALNKLIHLKLLNLKGDVVPSIVFTQSLPRLEIMEIKGRLDMTSEINGICKSLPNLTQLSLENTEISQDFIDELAMLPFLIDIALYTGSYRGNKLTFKARGFHKLRTMVIGLEKLKTLEIEDSALPMIEDPHIYVYSNDFEILIHGKRPKIVEKIRIEDENVFKKIKMISFDTDIFPLSKKEDQNEQGNGVRQ
ncbi:putative disease resistance RPP13-like protein 2 [Lolium perenne]|uniref:putative disease resistance RPP13-like protein 2 n=1 Tax=Lolium perenne TaxID=4522 RepID=UPI0021F5F85E|nr:putative disease resistance RPP13-like protein 2 [Lolium perenne]